MIPVFMQCQKCKKYQTVEEAEGGVQVRQLQDGKIAYVRLPAKWNVIRLIVADQTREACLCGDCLPTVIKEIFS